MTKKSAQMWAPLGKVYMDYTDQEVYSYCSSMVPGSEWISDKAKLAKCLKADGGVAGLTFLPTWYIHNKKWSLPPRPDGQWDATAAGCGPEHAPPAELSAALDRRCWFLKETNRNYAAGTFVKDSVQSCLAGAEEDKNYVVQPHYADPMLIAHSKKKFHCRLYIFAHSPAGKTHVDFYHYDIGVLAIAPAAWSPGSQERPVQITRDRSIRFEDWGYYNEVSATKVMTCGWVRQRLTISLVEQVSALFQAVSESLFIHIKRDKNLLRPTAKVRALPQGVDINTPAWVLSVSWCNLTL